MLKFINKKRSLIVSIRLPEGYTFLCYKTYYVDFMIITFNYITR